MHILWQRRVEGGVERLRAGPFSGTARYWPGGKNPVLVVDADSFETRFESDGGDNFWGYRFVAWAAGPRGWCLFAELMLSESKDCDRLCRALIAARPEAFGAHAAGPMVELSLMCAAGNDKFAAAALAVLDRARVRDASQLSNALVDKLLQPRNDGAMCSWHRMLTGNASPKLCSLLTTHPRLAAAVQSRDLFLEAICPERRVAALRLLPRLRGLPQGTVEALLAPLPPPGSAPRGVRCSSRWAALVVDDSCAKLVRELIACEPRLAQPALLAALSPRQGGSVLTADHTLFFDSLCRDVPGLELVPATIQELLLPRQPVPVLADASADASGDASSGLAQHALSLWDWLVLHAPWPRLQRLMAKHAELRQAALTCPELLVHAIQQPLGCVVAHRLLAEGALYTETLREALFCRLAQPRAPRPRDPNRRALAEVPSPGQLLLLSGLEDGHVVDAIQGFYHASDEEVGRQRLTAILPAKRDERRCVYYQVGGEHVLWFHIFAEMEEEPEHGLSDRRASKGAQMAEEEEDWGAEAECDEDEDWGAEADSRDADLEATAGGCAAANESDATTAGEATDGAAIPEEAEEEPEEPEEQDGQWVVTHWQWLGAKHLPDDHVLAELSDSALQPHRDLINSVWAVQEGVDAAFQRRERSAFRVQAASAPDPSRFPSADLWPQADLLSLMVDTPSFSAPLLAELLARDETLAPTIAARAFVHGTLEQLARQPALARLRLDGAAVRVLLEGDNASMWRTLLLPKLAGGDVFTSTGDFESLRRLMEEHSALKEAALQPDVLLMMLDACRLVVPRLFAVYLLESGAAVDAGMLRQWGREPQSEFRRLVRARNLTEQRHQGCTELVRAIIERVPALADVADEVRAGLQPAEDSGDEHAFTEDEEDEEESGGEEDDDAGDEGGGDEQEPPEVPQALEAIPIAQVQLMLQQLGFPTEGTDEELRARLLQSVLGMGMGEGDEDMGEWSEDE